jgi:hypothetical protein
MSVPVSPSGQKRFRRLSLAGRLSAFVVPLAGFPAEERELAPVRVFIRNLVVALVDHHRGSLETFLQMTHLHLRDGSRRVSDHGREWMPSMGLGVWPGREPPHGWTLEELRGVVPGERLRPMMNILLRLGNRARGGDARDVMLGLGTVVQFVVGADGKEFLNASRELLLPPIKEPSYTSFPFYVPLLDAKGLAGASEATLASWFCGAHACIRESPEDSGILIVGSESLFETVRLAGAVRLDGEADEWAIRA